MSDHHRNVTVESTKVQPRTLQDSNRYNSTCKTATRSLYEEGGSKNACIITDGGKIMSKCSTNTFYHASNNANRQQHHQQQYIKHALLKNSPKKTKYSTHNNISNTSNEEVSSRNSSNAYSKETNNVTKVVSLLPRIPTVNTGADIIESLICNEPNPSRNRPNSINKTNRKRANSYDNLIHGVPNGQRAHQKDKKRTTSVSVFCDTGSPENLRCEKGKDAGFVTILKINDTDASSVQKNAQLGNRKKDEYLSRGRNENTAKESSNPVKDVKINESQPRNFHNTIRQYQDNRKPFPNTKRTQTKVNKDGSVVVQVRDPSAAQKGSSLIDFNLRQYESEKHDYHSFENSSESTPDDDLKPLRRSLGTKSSFPNIKSNDVKKEVKRVHSNLSKPTKSSSLKRHSSVCSGDLNENRSKNSILPADRRSSVDKAIQCRVAPSNSFKFRSLVSLFIFIIIKYHIRIHI